MVVISILPLAEFRRNDHREQVDSKLLNIACGKVQTVASMEKFKKMSQTCLWWLNSFLCNWTINAFLFILLFLFRLAKHKNSLFSKSKIKKKIILIELIFIIQKWLFNFLSKSHFRIFFSTSKCLNICLFNLSLPPIPPIMIKTIATMPRISFRLIPKKITDTLPLILSHSKIQNKRKQAHYRIPTVKLKIPGKSRIQKFCYIQVIVFDLSYLPVAAVGT